MPRSPAASAAIIGAITQPKAPLLIPELCAPGLPEGDTMESFRARHKDLIGAGVPYWAVTWPGGQALARFLLDNPDAVAGRHVADVGCGNGLVAIAAMRAGAASAAAIDQDPNALAATEECARMNGANVMIRRADFETLSLPQGTVICAADLWYEPATARRASAALTRLARDAVSVLIADPDRPGRPRRHVTELARYAIAASPEFERSSTVETRVFNFAPEAILADKRADILAAHPPHAAGAHGNDQGMGQD